MYIASLLSCWVLVAIAPGAYRRTSFRTPTADSHRRGILDDSDSVEDTRIRPFLSWVDQEQGSIYLRVLALADAAKPRGSRGAAARLL